MKTKTTKLFSIINFAKNLFLTQKSSASTPPSDFITVRISKKDYKALTDKGLSVSGAVYKAIHQNKPKEDVSKPIIKNEVCHPKNIPTEEIPYTTKFEHLPAHLKETLTDLIYLADKKGVVEVPARRYLPKPASISLAGLDGRLSQMRKQGIIKTSYTPAETYGDSLYQIYINTNYKFWNNTQTSAF